MHTITTSGPRTTPSQSDLVLHIGLNMWKEGSTLRHTIVKPTQMMRLSLLP